MTHTQLIERDDSTALVVVPQTEPVILTQDFIRTQLYENDDYYRKAADTLTKRVRRGEVACGLLLGLVAMAVLIAIINTWD